MLDGLRRGAALVGLGLLNAPVSARFRVEGGSMLPTLADGESALAVRPGFPPLPGNRLRRGAVVVLTPPGGPGRHSYLKRIAALPGESVKLRDGRIRDGVGGAVGRGHRRPFTTRALARSLGLDRPP